MSDIYKKLIRQTFLILKKYDKAMDLKMTHCFIMMAGMFAVTVVENICDTLTEKISDLREQVQYVRKIAV